MNPSKALIIGTGIAYFLVAIDQYYRSNVGMALAYFGYAVSNIGLYMTVS